VNPNNNATLYSDLLARFQNIWLRDPTLLTWTADEVGDFLISAFNDPYLYIIDYDSSTVTVAQQPQYTVPSQFLNVTDILIDAAGDGYWVPIDPSAYTIINGLVIFNRYYKQMPGGKTLVFFGTRQLTVNDSIPVTYQEYILHMATAEAFEVLKTSLTSRFVKNDITMAGLIQSIETHRQRADELKQKLLNNYTVTM
jgi:hypothetical protein